MKATVRLTVMSATGPPRVHAFSERTTCVVGRSRDCDPQILGEDTKVSRHHCLFDVNPPDLRVRDLGSRNGTYVNGVEIGRHEVSGETTLRGSGTRRDDRRRFGERDLNHGDEVRVGDTVLRVSVSVEEETRPSRERRSDLCERCGREMSGSSPLRSGALLCAVCRSRPETLVLDLLHHASDVDGGSAKLRDYEVVRKLGHDGRGVVHLVRHRDSGELLALKTLLAEVAVSPHAGREFLREIGNTRSLRHPNIVEFRDAGAEGAMFFFVGEYCDLGSLDRLVAERGGPLPVEEAVRITLQALEGLAYAHTAPVTSVRFATGTISAGAGMVHRDIKPQNILLSSDAPDPVAKLADFGLARAFDRAGLSGHTRTGAVGGSVAFMPRIQILNYKSVGPEVDVWAMAASLYWMLTGTTPRTFPDGVDPIAVVLRERAVPIRERAAWIPHRLAEVIDDALVDNPRIAVRTADELAERLRDACQADV